MQHLSIAKSLGQTGGRLRRSHVGWADRSGPPPQALSQGCGKRFGTGLACKRISARASQVRSRRGSASSGLLVGFGWSSEATPENALVNRDQRPNLRSPLRYELRLVQTPCIASEVGLDARTASQRPHRNRKLTMLIPATSENVAAPHCSDERAVNSQKMARGGRGVAKF
jgi:hypothetical protein